MAVHLDPKHAADFNNRGLAESKLGKWQDAIQGHDRAIQLAPKCAAAFIHRGFAKVLDNSQDAYREQ